MHSAGSLVDLKLPRKVEDRPIEITQLKPKHKGVGKQNQQSRAPRHHGQGQLNMHVVEFQKEKRQKGESEEIMHLHSSSYTPHSVLFVSLVTTCLVSFLSA